MRQLANDVYFSSLEVGPEHVDTAGGFFHMGNVFYAQNRIENALAFFDKVTGKASQKMPPPSVASLLVGASVSVACLRGIDV